MRKTSLQVPYIDLSMLLLFMIMISLYDGDIHPCVHIGSLLGIAGKVLRCRQEISLCYFFVLLAQYENSFLECVAASLVNIAY